MRKTIFTLFMFFLAILPVFAFAEHEAQNKINLYFFYGDGCPHCAKEEIFLNKLEKADENVTIHRFETWHDKKNQDLLAKIAKELGITVRGVPFLVIGSEAVTGYYSDDVTGKKITDIISRYKETGCDDSLAPIVFGSDAKKQCEHGCETGDAECVHDCGCEADTSDDINTSSVTKTVLMAVPILGEINPNNFSLPILTIILAAIDGFNPCAMWTLLFLINLLLSMPDRKKMWILGIAFLVSSALVYFLFLSAWLNIVLFIGLVSWIRLIIALVAIGSGTFHLRDYFKKRGEEGCEVTKSEKRRKVFKNLRRIVTEEKFILALGGIIVLAALVNIVELLCSAGIPAAYVPILALAGLPKWQYYAYLLLYIFIFLLDDMVIFFIAMKTLTIKASDSKYMKYSSLVGGVILLTIGLLLMFKPGWLMFG